MKKKIIISVFLLLILATAVVFLISAVESYRFDMDPANGVDIMEGFGTAMLLVLGGYILFYEIDLFGTVYYFLFKPKAIVKSVLHILSNLCLVLVCFTGEIARVLSVSEEINVTLLILLIYVILRVVCLTIPVRRTQ